MNYSRRINIIRELKILIQLAFIIILMNLKFSHAGILDSLRQEHPRLLFTKAVRDNIINLQLSDTLLQKIIDIARFYAEIQIKEPPIKYEFDGPGDPRLKRERRAAMFRVFNLGMLYQLTGETRYALRVKQDLLATARFPDWGPNHFLNIGEICALMGIGYDWIYPELTADERTIIIEAIKKFGLNEGLKAYAGTHVESWWTTAMNNWNQVCNGGLVLAALAIAETDTAIAAQIVTHAVNSIPNAMKGYEPDGAWYEGPTYWAYGTTYNALFINAARTALGNTIQWDSITGYDWLGKSGNFHIQTIGPSNYYFNFGDSKDIFYFSPVLFWMSQEYHQPVYAWYERWICDTDLPRMQAGELMLDDTLDRFFGLLVVWYNPQGQSLGYHDLSLDAHFRGDAANGAMRSGWDKDALYVAFKGGYNQANHGHLDIGSFVIDAHQIRWAMDLGGDDYDALPGYFDMKGQRWQYYRCSNKGHNTLVIDNLNQNYNARVPIKEFYSTPDSACAVIDLSQAYKNQVSQIIRTFKMLNRKIIKIEDNIQFKYPGSKARWAMITGAEIQLRQNLAILRQFGKELYVKILQPTNASFEILSTDPGDPRQEKNIGTQMLALTVFGGDGNQSKIDIQITPDKNLSLIEMSSREINQPDQFNLAQNFPNPFNATTLIHYHLFQTEKVKLRIYNENGRLIRMLVDTEQQPGFYQPVWDGKNDAGHIVVSGVYFVQLTGKYQVQNRKMVLLR
ncbi:heparinase II/III family protein [candidate division KSB1 bacterium]|nr:heparinase II/III family protein [candidate division KSB1 bacterium]